MRYTGLKDKKGTRIYENNEVKYKKLQGIVRFGHIPRLDSNNKCGHLGFYIDWTNDENKITRQHIYYWIEKDEFEVVKDYKYIDYEGILESAIDTFGVDKQLIVAIEELSELQKSISKYIRYDNDKEQIVNILEEIVDVDIMIRQLKKIFDYEQYYEIMTKEKILKIDEYIKKEK